MTTQSPVIVALDYSDLASVKAIAEQLGSIPVPYESR